LDAALWWAFRAGVGSGLEDRRENNVVERISEFLVGESNPLSSHTVTTMSPESGTTMICWPWLPKAAK
jgi:hypothetical protein